MLGNIASRITELRFLEGIEKVERVAYQAGDQFWVRFNRPIDLPRLEEIVRKSGYEMVRFGTVPSMLPRGLAEMLWDGVTYAIGKKITGWAKFTSYFGFEPNGIAKIALDLHGPYQIFITNDEEGVKILYDYLGLKYVPPPPPAPAKPEAVAATRQQSVPIQPAQPKPAAQSPPQSAPAAEKPADTPENKNSSSQTSS